MKIISLLILLLIPRISQGETIQFFGDVLLSRGIEETIKHEGIASLWNGTASIYSRDAIRVANLEGAVGDNSECTDERKLCFHIDIKTLSALDNFDVISLANNHSLDLGVKGRSNTIRELVKRSVIPLGGRNYSTSISTDNGLISIVALTDVVNSSNDKSLVTLADSPEAIREIQRLKKISSLVAVYVHWGQELNSLPTPHMRKLANAFIDVGADIIVGHHPHVVGKTECIKGKPVVYSLGNYLFDQKYEDTKKGAVLQCSHSKDGYLKCSLIGVQTAMNSFIPYVADKGIAYPEENKTLSTCTPIQDPVWSGIFSVDKVNRKYTRRYANKEKSLSILQQVEIEHGDMTWKSPLMPIEKIQVVDLNSDGLLEVMLIQNIFSTLDNEIAKRVYIYSLNKGLKALWRGSGLSRPLIDAVFAKSPKSRTSKPILIALHSTDSFLVRDPQKDGCILMSYRWNGFGFTGVKEKRYQLAADKLSLSKDKVRLIKGDGVIVAEVGISELI